MISVNKTFYMKLQNWLLCISISLLCIISLSCKKFLDKKSNSSLAIPNTIENLQGLMDDYRFMNMGTPSYGEASGDDYFLLLSDYRSMSGNDQKVYAWIPYDYNYSNDWSFNYRSVYNSNLCLERIETIPKDNLNKLNWNNIKGSGLFFRAFSFLNLSWAFAKSYDETTASTDLGIVLRLGSDFNVPSIRSSVKESYERIISDAKEAASLLPDNPAHVMRPSKAAAYGLLARAYLSMRKYDSSLKYADLSLQINSSLLNFNTDIPNISSNNPFQKFNKETIFYTEMGSLYSSVLTFYAKIDTMLYSMYDMNDLRRAAFFRPVSGYQQFKGNYAAHSYIQFSGLATDELYLIRSESYARNGMVIEAMNDLNTLMQTRWRNTVPFPTITATDAADALKKILSERRKELLMRGTRWSDIKRLNKEGANIILKRVISGEEFMLPPNDSKYALPLPKDIIDQTGIQQN